MSTFKFPWVEGAAQHPIQSLAIVLQFLAGDDDAALRQAIDALPTAIFVCDERGAVTHVNSACAALVGMTADTDIERCAALARLINEPARARGVSDEDEELHLQRPDDTRIRVRRHTSALLDANGAVAGQINMLVSIADAKPAAKAFNHVEGGFRALTKATSEVVFRISPDWAEMRRVDDREFLAETAAPISTWLERYIPEDEQARIREAIEQSVRNKRPLDLEHRVYRLRGVVGWAHSRAVPVFDERGAIVEWFGAASDVTRRKEAEEMLDRQRRLYEGVLSTTPDLAYIFDRDHRFIYANEGLLRMWGKSWNEAIGKNCLELGYEPWHAAMHGREIDQVVATKQSVRGVVPFTGTFGRRMYDYILTPVLDSQGEVQAVAGITRDVTEFKVLEEARQASEERLAVELASMRRLHELSVRLAQIDDLETVMGEVMSAACELLGAERGTAQLVEQDAAGRPVLRLAANTGFESSFTERFRLVTGEGFTTCAAALRRRGRVIVDNLAANSEFKELGACMLPIGVAAAMSIPLMSSEGSLVGLFTTYWDRPHHPDEHQLRFMDLYVQVAARQIERRVAERALRTSELQLESQVADLEALRQLGLRVATSSDSMAALHDVLDTAIAMVGAAKGNVQLFDAGEGALKLIAYRGFTAEFLEEFKAVPAGYSCCGIALRDQERVVIENVFTDSRVKQFGEVYARHGFVAVQSTPLMSSDGRLLGMFSTHFAKPYRLSERDVRLMDQLAQQAGRIIERSVSEQALRKSEERYRQLVSLMPAAVYACDASGAITFYNERAAQLWGRWPRTADLSDRFCGSERLLRDDGTPIPREECPMAAALRDGTAFRNQEANIRRPDGGIVPVSVNVDPIRDEHGRVTGAISVFHDITVIREAEKTLRRHQQVLEETVAQRTEEVTRAQRALASAERMASLGTLAAGLGHDMGNLLVPVRVRLECLAAMPLPEEAKQEVTGIKGSAEYLQKLASGLRLLAVDPDAATRHEPTELRDWWQEAQTVLRSALPRGVALEAQLPEEPCWVDMSKTALLQAVFNLVQNAGDAVRERSHGVVTVVTELMGGIVRVRISDNGPGMTEEVKRRCMEPFFTTKTRGLSTGLGLALVYGLVQKAGGRIQLDSELGVGTTFTLELSAATAPESRDSKTALRSAFIDVQDPRMRAIVSAELEYRRFAVHSDPDRAATSDLVVTDHGRWKGESTARLLALTTRVEAPEAAIALGDKPKVQEVRDAIRQLSQELVTQ